MSIFLSLPNVGIDKTKILKDLPLTFEVFPDKIQFLDGASFPEWMSTSIFGVEHKASARALMEYFNPKGVASGKSGVISTLFIAEAYANFGKVGLVLAPIFVGLEIQFLHNYILSNYKTPSSVAIYGYFMIAFPLTSGIVGFVWNVGWMFIALIFILGFIISSSNLKFNTNNSVTT